MEFNPAAAPSSTPFSFRPAGHEDRPRQHHSRRAAPTEEGSARPLTNLSSFAKKYRLRTRRDEDGTTVIRGSRGHIYDHCDGLSLGLMLMPGKPFVWANARRKLAAAGFTIWQDCDEEGSALFSPTDPTQVRLAIRLAGIKRIRRQTGKGRPFTAKRVLTPLDFALTHAGQGYGAAQKATIAVPVEQSPIEAVR